MLIQQIQATFCTLPDSRKGSNCHYAMSDAALSAFSVFFMQNPSFLAQQKSLEKSCGQNNVETLFGVHKTPCDNQIRYLLDTVSPTEFYPIFNHIFNGLIETGYLKPFQSIEKSLLVALDGVEYFSSEKIHCDCCSTQEFKKGKIRYSHKAITPVIVSPTQSQVIPLAPEFITPQDGCEKQDCELNASKRWLERDKERFGSQNITILGDDLYSHQPFCQLLLAQDKHFILVCKQESHQTLYEWLDDFEREGKIKTHQHKKWNGKQYIITEYRYMNQVPLRNDDEALMVNWCEVRIKNSKGKVLYYNTFITDFTITNKTIKTITEAGRARWKIENENNNTLKTKGYHFEHNFGHGKQYLASVLATLILLAFLFHTILEYFDECYRLLREHLSSREMFFDDIRALTRYLCFESWQDLLEFMLERLEIPIPKQA
ncbi:MAG: ISNCY family transposase [Methylococcales bacterium]|nr:ISNCY family transposase [Methylococcales bacterium]